MFAIKNNRNVHNVFTQCGPIQQWTIVERKKKRQLTFCWFYNYFCFTLVYCGLLHDHQVSIVLSNNSWCSPFYFYCFCLVISHGLRGTHQHQKTFKTGTSKVISQQFSWNQDVSNACVCLPAPYLPACTTNKKSRKLIFNVTSYNGF